MGNVVIFLLAVLLANVSGWGAYVVKDTSYRYIAPSPGIIYPKEMCGVVSCPSKPKCTLVRLLYVSKGGEASYSCPTDRITVGGACTEGGSICSFDCRYNCYQTQCEADSVACLADMTKIWDSENCQCKPKGPPTPPPEGCTYCEDYLGWAEDQSSIGAITIQVPYSKMYHCSTCYKDDNGYIISAGDCTEMRNSPGTCQQNGDCPTNQICADSTGNDSPVECIAIIGPNVWLRDVKTGNTFKCEADGDCARAKQLVASGECKNPYADKNKPNSSDSDNPDSSSSGENPNSSSSGTPPESSGEYCDMCDKLDRIAANTQATMNNTSDISQWTLEIMNKSLDIDNHLTEIGIDVNHIRTNTEATATNTGSIDNKLNTTNSLLNDIKNKNWDPQINFNPNITVVDSVKVNVDTSKSPFEILSILRQNNYNGNDTVGTAATESSLIARIDSSVNEGLPNMKDSIPKAVQGVRSALYNLRDTLNKGAYMDSVTAWQIKLVDNGVLTGGGSQDCPEPLRRSFTWNLGSKLGVIQIGSFKYICDDLLGIGITLWGLARMVLRCMVSILCMLWIYRTVIGVEGSNDED